MNCFYFEVTHTESKASGMSGQCCLTVPTTAWWSENDFYFENVTRDLVTTVATKCLSMWKLGQTLTLCLPIIQSVTK